MSHRSCAGPVIRERLHLRRPHVRVVLRAQHDRCLCHSWWAEAVDIRHPDRLRHPRLGIGGRLAQDVPPDRRAERVLAEIGTALSPAAIAAHAIGSG